jgi:hypothetical protein
MSEIRSGSFETLVASPHTHVALDLHIPSETLLILFGGIAGGVSMPVFEFFRVTIGYPAKKAFLRDPRRGWYLLGIPGVGDSASAVKTYLDSVIAQAGATRIVMAGASAGGFAAILFGSWCSAHEVVAFSPQSFVDAENRNLAGDDRWPEQIAALHAATNGTTAPLDLRLILPRSARTTRYQIHVSNDDMLDLLHAGRLADRGGVEIVTHDRGGHRLVKTLRDRGLLEPLLLNVLSGHSVSDESAPTLPGP